MSCTRSFSCAGNGFERRDQAHRHVRRRVRPAPHCPCGAGPSGQAWHKARELTQGAHRLEMARLAFDGVPGAVVDGRELRRAGPTYTVDTLRELTAEFPGAQLLLVIGADQAEALHSWRESAE